MFWHRIERRRTGLFSAVKVGVSLDLVIGLPGGQVLIILRGFCCEGEPLAGGPSMREGSLPPLPVGSPEVMRPAQARLAGPEAKMDGRREKENMRQDLAASFSCEGIINLRARTAIIGVSQTQSSYCMEDEESEESARLLTARMRWHGVLRTHKSHKISQYHPKPTL